MTRPLGLPPPRRRSRGSLCASQCGSPCASQYRSPYGSRYRSPYGSPLRRRAGGPRPSPGRPLAGLTVLEAGRRIQAPLAAHLLGLLGAEVVRIEPPGGDPLRGMPPACSGVSARWLALNRGKEAVEIDIKSPGGRRELRAAAAGADVFLHNWAPGKAAELGLDSDDLARDNPALVYAYTGGWGGRVPDAPWAPTSWSRPAPGSARRCVPRASRPPLPDDPARRAGRSARRRGGPGRTAAAGAHRPGRPRRLLPARRRRHPHRSRPGPDRAGPEPPDAGRVPAPAAGGRRLDRPCGRRRRRGRGARPVRPSHRRGAGPPPRPRAGRHQGHHRPVRPARRPAVHAPDPPRRTRRPRRPRPWSLA